MSEYLILAETIIYKNNKLTCINTYDNFKSVAMPAEFNFDMAILCGPKWSVGEHNLRVKAMTKTVAFGKIPQRVGIWCEPISA